MYKIAVLGTGTASWASRPWGWIPSLWTAPTRPATTLHRLAREAYAIIYITEQLAQTIPDDVARYKTDVTPAVILIPGKTGSLGLGAQALKSAVERAVGADIS